MRDIDEVAQVRQALRRLARRREALREAERRRIGLELHDDLQQKLALLRFDMVGLRQELVPPDPAPTAVCLGRLERVEQLLEETMEATRRLVQDLRPPILQEFGLPPALQSLAASHRLAHGQKVDVQVRGPDQWTALPEETATALYRVAQEALNNIRKHSKARTVDMVVEIKPSGHVLMEVSDDGDGFDVEGAGALTNGNGLRGMQERIQSLSGTLRIMSKPGAGTAVLVEVPLSAEEAPGSEPGALRA
jgi:protein-histidine pros-kinase